MMLRWLDRNISGYDRYGYLIGEHKTERVLQVLVSYPPPSNEPYKTAELKWEDVPVVEEEEK